MTDLRLPTTFAHAVTRIAGRLRWDGAAAIVGRRERSVRRWSEPRGVAHLSIESAVRLDAAWAAAGGEGAPLLEAYAAQLEQRVAERTACHRLLADELALAMTEDGEAAAAALAIILPGASPGAIHRALVQADEAETAWSTVKRRIGSFLPFGAGPNASRPGGTT